MIVADRLDRSFNRKTGTVMKKLLTTLALSVALTGPAAAIPSIYVYPGDWDGMFYGMMDAVGYDYTKFEAYDDGWAPALANADVIVLGRAPGLNYATSDETRQALKTFVSNGGTLIFHSPLPNSYDNLGLINDTFGLSVISTDPKCYGSDTFSLNADAASGTAFEGGPTALSDLNCLTYTLTSSLPEEALNLYGDDTYSVVYALGVGLGQLTVLGWDGCYDCENPADIQEAWVEVMRRAINFKASDWQPGTPPVDVPEAATLSLFGFGLAAAALSRRRRAA